MTRHEVLTAMSKAYWTALDGAFRAKNEAKDEPARWRAESQIEAIEAAISRIASDGDLGDSVLGRDFAGRMSGAKPIDAPCPIK